MTFYIRFKGVQPVCRKTGKEYKECQDLSGIQDLHAIGWDVNVIRLYGVLCPTQEGGLEDVPKQAKRCPGAM